MTQTAADLESIFKRAWTLFAANLIIVVPGLVLAAITGIVVAVIAVFLIGAALTTGATGSTTVGVLTIGGTVLVGLALVIGIAVVGTAFATGMAGSLWKTGTTTLSDGFAAFEGRGGQIFLLVVLLLAIGLVALILAPVTLLLSMLAYTVFFIYSAASVIIGRRSATEAVAESCRLASHNFWPTVGMAAIIIVVTSIAGLIGGEFGRLQVFLGGLFGFVLQQAVVAYVTVVVVGEYLRLRGGEPEVALAQSSAAPAP